MKTIEWYRFDPSHVIFQHNPKTKLDQQWLLMQSFDVLTWPLRSHDQNPMAHVGALVIQKLNEYITPAKGTLQLWELVQASSQSISA